MPDVPTVEEAAGLKGFDASSWFGLFAPAGTPRTIVDRIQADGAKALAVTSRTRSPALPDVPTIEEAAGLKGFDASSWFGLFAPAGTPRPIVDKVQADVARALSQPEVRERFVAQGADPGGNTPDQFAAFVRAETDKWTRVVKFSNAKVD